MTERIAIRGGHVVDPSNGIEETLDLYLAEGRVVSLGTAPDGYMADRTISAEGQIVCPGFIDLCARLREPGYEHKAAIASESEAASASGITTLCCPPDTDPVIDTPAVVNLIRERAQQIGKIRVLPIGALTRDLKGRDLSEMSALKRAGCVALSNAHAPMANTLVLRRALEYAASHDLLVVIRPEDPWLADQGCVHEGPTATRLGLPGIPDAAETVAIAQVLALVEHTEARVHFAQLSCARAARMIARAREKGAPVSADVAAHQLHMTETDIDGFNAMCHVRPPLRSVADRDALREALRNGVITAICSDHQPHEPDAKLDVFPSTEPGMASLEMLLPLTLKLVDEDVLSLSQAIALLTQGPAAVMGTETGALSVGSPADICIFDPECTWTVDSSTWRSTGRNTPYWGQTVKGRVTRTFVDGRAVFEL
ncbi:dihydroorotase [Methylocaldum gracile]|jgi:dihydroorotase|uniref:dihydroorotase n=1 Tax=Methylocaldum sp. 0917 TaxID=2485163 RepID=UPI00105C4213